MADPIDIGKGRAKRPPNTPPRAPRASTDEKPRSEPTSKPRSPQDRKLGEAVSGLYGMAGMGLVGIGMRVGDDGLTGTGVATVNMADSLAEAWLDLADRNPRVKSMLRRLTEVSATGQLVGMHIAVLTPLLASRGVIPAGFANVAGSGPEPPSPNGNGGHAV